MSSSLGLWHPDGGVAAWVTLLFAVGSGGGKMLQAGFFLRCNGLLLAESGHSPQLNLPALISTATVREFGESL